MSVEDSAVRIATILSTAMNIAAILDNDSALTAINAADLRSTLLWIVDEMSWMLSEVAVEGASSVSWPSDAGARIDGLRAHASAWDAAGAPPSGLVSAARSCLGLLTPT
jgi:hypothetical protein